MPISSTQRTLKELRKMGRKCWIVEYWNPHVKRRIDMFNIIDIVALDPKGVVGVQSCGQSFAAHYRKLTEEKAEETTNWLETPGTSLELWGWRKVKVKRGGKAVVWKPRILEITLDNMLKT